MNICSKHIFSCLLSSVEAHFHEIKADAVEATKRAVLVMVAGSPPEWAKVQAGDVHCGQLSLSALFRCQHITDTVISDDTYIGLTLT